MWVRFTFLDLRVIGHYLGALMLLVGAMMLLPAVIALATYEWSIAINYLIGIGVAGVVGSLLRMVKVSPSLLNRKQAVAVTGLAWLLGSIIAAVPLFLSGHYLNFFDAVFEGMSGLTATGFTLVQDLDHLSYADNTWRLCLQLVGGQGIIVVALSLGLFSRMGGSTVYSTEGRSEHILPNIRQTSQFIWRFSLVVIAIGTIIFAVACCVRGMSVGRSLLHGFWLTVGSYDTGGFTGQRTGILYYHSPLIEFLLMVFMLMGTVNFTLYGELCKGRWKEFFKDIEIKTLALWITTLMVFFTCATLAGSYFTDASTLFRRGVFTIVSAAANGGFQVLSSVQMQQALTTGTFFMIALAMSIGGSSGSTAGGIKAMRLGVIFKNIVAQVKGVLSPDKAVTTTTYYHAGRRQLDPQLISASLVVTMLYIVSYLAGAVLAVALGYDAIPAIFESIAAISNAGMTAGIVGVGMPYSLKLVYFIQMWIGRLEFLTLLALVVAFLVSLKPQRRVKRTKVEVSHEASHARRGRVQR